MSYSPILGDVEAGGWGDKGPDGSYLFAERTVRQGFVRKVFGLLSLQLLLTAAITAVFSLHGPTKAYVLTNSWVFWSAFAANFALIIVMACWEDARRKHPFNLIVLAAFTGLESVLVGIVSATYNPESVLLAVGITACVVVALTLFTLQTKIDFTPAAGVLYTFLWTLILAGIVGAVFRIAWLHLAMAVGGALLFSVYIVLDLQMTLGTNRYSISPDEYVFATLNLYLDIINLFLYILQLVNEMQRN